MDKITALLHEAKIEADENRSKDTRYFAASVVEVVEELQEQLAAALAACEEKNRGLDKLARLGNEPYLGNSVGNNIAAEFLAIQPDASILKQRDAELIERCACVCDTKIIEFNKDSEQYDCQEDSSYLNRKWGAEECAEAIRELKANIK